MLRTALRPANIGLLFLMLVVAVVCGALANWQWDRAQSGLRAQEQDQALQQVAAVPLQSLIDPQETFTTEAQTRPVSVEGSFDPDRQALVPNRVIDGAEATIILTAFVVPQEDGTEAVLPVARGWVSDASDPAVAAVPEGPVRLEGWLQVSEVSQLGRIDEQHIGEISSPLLVNEWGGPIYTGYLAQSVAAVPLDGQTLPDASASPMERPQTKHEQGLDIQNLGYAVQWIVFGAFFVYLWWRTVRDQYLAERDEARDRLLAADPEAHPDASTNPPPRGLGLLRAYQVIATVEGIALATMTVLMFVEYVIFGGDTWFSTTNASLEGAVAIGWAIHGSLYMMYLAVAVVLWRRMRWPVSRLFLLALYGVVPFVSFWFEARVSKRLRAELGAVDASAGEPFDGDGPDGPGDAPGPDGRSDPGAAARPDAEHGALAAR